MKSTFMIVLLLACTAVTVPPPCKTLNYDGPKVDDEGAGVCRGRCFVDSQPPQYGYVMQVCEAPEERAPCFIDHTCVCCVLPLRG